MIAGEAHTVELISAWCLASYSSWTSLRTSTARVPDDNIIPPLDAHGALALDDLLELELEGTLARWPAAWPALPAPLDDASAETAFALAYAGRASLQDVARLSLQRGDARADSRLQLQRVTDWIATMETGSPLPPIDATASIQRLEIAGAVLHGVEMTLEDPATDGDE